jgi:endonuclease YncB( thermonuclease family)
VGFVGNVVDGDTIDVTVGGQEFRVRYIGVNTPERDEVCYTEATQANADLVAGQTAYLVRDVSNTDRFDRLLRYIYVEGAGGEFTFVNAELVAQGYAEAVRYDPDTAYLSLFRDLEAQARAANLGCHGTGIFDD